MIKLPSLCPRCRSTAVSVGLVKAHCFMCNWDGRESDLLRVASGGLALEDLLGRFTRDLLEVISANLSKPLGEFLLRWEVVKEKDSAPMKWIIGTSVVSISDAVLSFILEVSKGAEDKAEGGTDGG